MPPVELWFDLASTYSYLAASRIEPLAAAAGRRVLWRPFLLGPIFQAQLGYADSPFNRHPLRGAYMWRDLERLCGKYGLPLRRPSVFPRNSLTAARVACLGEDQPWIAPFARAVFTANFAEDRDIADPVVVAALLEGLGLPARQLLARAGEQASKDHLRARTAEAATRGVFGGPTLFAGGELFWGNDRLEDALAWPG
jgi:2-hydroxychromene-2-carboxylate isomerase